jgi:hypothetical protein
MRAEYLYRKRELGERMTNAAGIRKPALGTSAVVPILFVVFLFSATLSVTVVAAQQVTGTLGSAGATTTLNGKQLPEPPSEVRRSDQGKRKGLNTLVASARSSTEGRS